MHDSMMSEMGGIAGLVTMRSRLEWMPAWRISYLSTPFTRAELDALVSTLT